MPLLKPSDLIDAAARKWPAVLRAEATGAKMFPLQVPFRRPRISDEYQGIRSAVESLASAKLPWRIEWQEVNTRKWGKQRWPVRVTFESPDDRASALGHSREL